VNIFSRLFSPHGVNYFHPLGIALEGVETRAGRVGKAIFCCDQEGVT